MYKFTAIIIAMTVAALAFGADEVLPQDAQALVDKAMRDVNEAESKALTVKFITYTALADKLQIAQERATKAGKLDAALAIKAKVSDLKKTVDDIAALRKPAEAPVVLAGTYAFNFVGSGHMGTLEVKDDTAKEVKTNIRGGLVQDGNTYTILWSNNTQWTITRNGTDLTMSSSDGESKLVKLSK
jgi:hypothetical protein